MGSWNFAYDTLNRLTAAASGPNAPTPYANNYGCWSHSDNVFHNPALYQGTTSIVPKWP
jgi:hypothetical protein